MLSEILCYKEVKGDAKSENMKIHLNFKYIHPSMHFDSLLNPARCSLEYSLYRDYSKEHLAELSNE